MESAVPLAPCAGGNVATCTFEGLPLEDARASRRAEPRGGLQVVDLRSAGVQRPIAPGLKRDEIRWHVRVRPGERRVANLLKCRR